MAIAIPTIDKLTINEGRGNFPGPWHFSDPICIQVGKIQGPRLDPGAVWITSLV